MALKVNTELCSTFNQSDIKAHARKKAMWGGSFDPSAHEDFVLVDQMLISKTITYADSLYKSFDEVIVNVVDQWVKSRNSSKKYRTDRCIIEFARDGYISIFNNGQGIPVDVVKNLKGEPVYIPELISTEFLAGSNNVEDTERITGGVNGIGLSMVNNNSTHFILETADIDRKKYYEQECHNRLTRIDPPCVKSLSSLTANIHKKGGTTIKFLPAYEVYKFDLADDIQWGDLDCVFKARALQIAAHTNMSVMYNGEHLLTDKKNKIESFASMFIDGEYVYERVKNTYDWDVVIGLSDGSGIKTLSIINGVYVKTGNHINYIRDLVISAIKVKTEKLLKKYRDYKKSMLANNLCIIISGNIPNPDFDSQTKTNISGSITKYKGYELTTGFLRKVWAMIEPRLVEQFLTDPMQEKKIKKASTSGIKKYSKATYAGTNKARDCTLLICEGDSAETMTRTAFTSDEVELDYDYYGTFNIGGVPMNSRKKTKVVNGKNGSIRLHRQKDLIDNERLTSLACVLNLNYSFRYETKEELASLSYGRVTINVDQDLDGIGQIMGLLLSHFHRFWPTLIKIGFITQLETPIIRAYPKSGTAYAKSFYKDEDYRMWVDSKFGNDDVTKKWEIKYYKGLATHNDDEAVHIFKHFSDHLKILTLDDLANAMFDVYFGEDTSLRKIELSVPPITIDGKEQNVKCSDHLQSSVKEFQLDNMMRKLPNIFDGINPARRKVLAGMLRRCAGTDGNGEIKVFQLAGYVAEKMNYHHGGASLANTITSMAQTFVGANNFPLLLPLSQFGGRGLGGKDHGAARYIKTKMNTAFVTKMFRSEDTYVLKHCYDEGVCNEPVHYVPVAPYALMESLELPATGWKYEGYARNWNDIYKCVMHMIDNYQPGTVVTPAIIPPMRFWAEGWRGSIRTYSNGTDTKQYSVGVYEYDDDKDILTITELPYRLWTKSYIDKIKKKPDVQGIRDKSTKKAICIHVKLKPGAYKHILSTYGDNVFDPFEDYFNLKESMNDHLNYINRGAVHSCKGYQEVVSIWFMERWETYVRRFDRQIHIIKLRIKYFKEVIKFVDNHNKYNFSKMDEETANTKLKNDGYIQFNKSLLDNPKFTSLDRLNYLVSDNKASGTSFDYLFAIGPRQRMEASRVKRDADLKYQEDLLVILTAPGAIKRVWTTELNELNDSIQKAFNSDRGWMYKERKTRLK